MNLSLIIRSVRYDKKQQFTIYIIINDTKTSKNTLILIDSSLVETTKKSIRKIEATKTAEKLGNKKVANMVMAGVILKELDLYDIKNIRQVFKESRFKDEMIKLNMKALKTYK